MTEIDPQPASFEAALKELEAIVTRLEQGDLPLEETLALHARGQRLAEWCASHLDQAELKLRTLSAD
ncbi:MAG: exodeoxyribonuclease VII small subunit [Anaerolineae bacterium]|nr:exodeoxyribonuclease VII small subunit [Thermoflexales bacterium]MDW8395332.1 exodeoxyribonuclease VII small subunit [Anaerolineae bacterium]